MFHILVQRFEVAPTAFHVKKYSPNEVKEWFGGDARIRMLDQLFAELRHRGYTINIATRGMNRFTLFDACFLVFS
jgi:hypothetical protein